MAKEFRESFMMIISSASPPERNTYWQRQSILCLINRLFTRPNKERKEKKKSNDLKIQNSNLQNERDDLDLTNRANKIFSFLSQFTFLSDFNTIFLLQLLCFASSLSSFICTELLVYLAFSTLLNLIRASPHVYLFIQNQASTRGTQVCPRQGHD